MFNRSKKQMAKFDWILFLVTIALCVYGIICVYSAVTSTGGTWRSLTSQLLATGLGMAFILFLQFVDTDYLKKLAVPGYILSVLLLVATMLFGVGEDVWGARSWLDIGPITFQPSEFVKIALILSLAVLLERYQDRINKVQTILILAVSMGIPLLLILKQPDYGTAAVMIFFLAMMIFYARIHWGYILAALALVVIAAPIIYNTQLTMKQQERILNFLDPLRDINGSGYQTYQGMIAIGSGRLFGKGYLQGTQSRFGFVPERDTDYIFAVLTEEFGFLGALLLLVLYAILLIRILIIVKNAKDLFSKTMCLGAGAMIFIHIFENIGMTIGLMPVTGIPLPLLSNGGTFQLINLALIGLILSVSTQRTPLDFNTRG